MIGIPRAPLILGLAGLLPFLFGALLSLGFNFNPPDRRFDLLFQSDGPRILLVYGTIILSFMGGALWGFWAHRASFLDLVLSVSPSLWAFACLILGATRWRLDGVEPLYLLAAGFVMILFFDNRAHQDGSAPDWWMKLRFLLTSIAVPCLGIGAAI